MKIVRFCIGCSLALGLLFGLVALWPHWPGDMIAAFRLQLLILALVGFAISLSLKRRWIVGFAAIVLMLHALPMGARLIQRASLPETMQTGRKVSLVFSNVLADNRSYDKVLALVEAEDADIIAAAETSPEWIGALSELKSIYPYSYAPDVGVFGVALYAKRPFKAEIARIGRYNMTLMRADFSDFIVYVAHPMPPASPTLAEDNKLYLDDLAARISSETKPVIVTGDFNATLWSGSIGPLIRQKLQWPSGAGIRHTWPADRSLLAIQIDHVLTKGAMAGRLKALPEVGSDHRPVRADLVLP